MMRFIVYGAGAVGGVIGARLVLAGHDVQLVARGTHLEAIRSSGLRLQTPEGAHTVQVPAASSVADLDVSADTAVLVTVKSQQTQAVVDDLGRHVPDTTTIVSVQNGVSNERSLLRTFGHVLGVTVMLPSTHLEPGLVVQNSGPVPGMLDVGRYPSGTDERCEEFAAAVRSAGFDSIVRPDVMAWKHRKLVANLGNGVQASCAPGDDRDRLQALVRAEVEAVLAAAGIPAGERSRRRRAARGPAQPRCHRRSWRRLHLAEPAARHRLGRDRLPERRDLLARPAAPPRDTGERPGATRDARARPYPRGARESRRGRPAGRTRPRSLTTSPADEVVEGQERLRIARIRKARTRSAPRACRQ